MIFHGGHLVGHWSKIQNGPAPSSGEAELNAGSKGLSEVLGIRHFLEQVGINTSIIQYLDASAAKGTMLRKGAGKIKHLEVRQLWCQYAVERYGVKVVKIPRKLNLADTLTHPVGSKDMRLFYEAVGCELRSLEPASAMDTKGDSSRGEVVRLIAVVACRMSAHEDRGA